MTLAIIHRDIKPANILLTMTGDGSQSLTDFGLVKEGRRRQMAGSNLLAGAVLGTLDFMPPEQRKDAALVDARSDLWSSGVRRCINWCRAESPKIIRFSLKFHKLVAGCAGKST